MHRARWIVLVALLPAAARAQWLDVKKLGTAGEPFVSTDGQGHVYVTGHLPATVFTSDDWGATFTARPFDGYCDISTYAWPGGAVNRLWMTAKPWGIKAARSTDFGKTWTESVTLDGPVDRPWFAAHPPTGRIWFLYVDGYIGHEPVPGKGSVLNGVFLAGSTDGGKTFAKRGRVDREPDGRYGADPYLACSADGTLYAMWGVTRDKNTIASYELARSSDGGASFGPAQTLVQVRQDLGDTQERWMLASLVAVGASTVVAFCPDYDSIDAGDRVVPAMVIRYRVSTDGGVTFGKARTVSAADELGFATARFEAAKTAGARVNSYVQTLTWACVDPWGRVHVGFQDNRDGHAPANEGTQNRWHVRVATMTDLVHGFGPSERVSASVVQARPSLDFLGLAADRKFLYVAWSEQRHSTEAFTGDLYLGRKPLRAPK